MKCISRHLAEHVVVAAVPGEVPVGDTRECIWLFLWDIEHQNELIGIWIGKRSQKHSVDDAEDGGVGADAQRERQNGDGGEARTLAEHAGGIAQVLRGLVQEAPAARLAALLLERLEVTEFDSCAPRGLRAVHAGPDKIIGVERKMVTEFLVHVAFLLIAMDRAAQDGPEFGKGAHSYPGAAFR